MEVFSTHPRAVLPWTANILTMATLVAATWWSAGQRPVSTERPMFAGNTNVASLAAHQQSKEQAQADASAVSSGKSKAPDAARSQRLLPLGQAYTSQPAVSGDAVQQVMFVPGAGR